MYGTIEKCTKSRCRDYFKRTSHLMQTVCVLILRIKWQNETFLFSTLIRYIAKSSKMVFITKSKPYLLLCGVFVYIPNTSHCSIQNRIAKRNFNSIKENYTPENLSFRIQIKVIRHISFHKLISFYSVPNVFNVTTWCWNGSNIISRCQQSNFLQSFRLVWNEDYMVENVVSLFQELLFYSHTYI